MQWQDLVLTIGQLTFIGSLLPSILSKDKPALATSLISSVVLFIFAYVYTTISLYFTAVSIALLAAGWAFLAFQKYNIDRKKQNK